MTAAQKIAKEKFKKAIAYRQKTGVSLKEAFAHVYGKKVSVFKKTAKKKVVHKKAAKKVGKVSSKYKHPKYHLHNINTKKNIVSFANIKDAKEFLQDAKQRGLNVKITSAKKVGAVKHKVVRKKVAKKKKISENSILNKIHKVKHDVERLDEAQHKHMVGMNNDIYHKMALVNTEIIAKERGIRKWIQLKKGLVEKYGLSHYKKIQNNQRKMINELKKHKTELKKLL